MSDARAPWWQEGVFYQIYPRSFQDSNGDGIGDLPGIAARLDHLNGATGSLGVDGVWLSPFYPSPNADFGYDVSDYCGVHPEYGTLADFDRLVAEAHRRGIRVIVDLVPNHTSDRHPWFVEARASRDNPKRAWYVWADPKPDGAPPNNWRSAFRGVGAAWTFDERTGQYYLHHFLPQQPDLNWWNPEVRQAMERVLRFWLDRGADGFRIDVAHGMIKDPELRDNPRVKVRGSRSAGRPVRLRNWDHPGVHEVLRGFRRILDEYDAARPRVAVGETGVHDHRRLARYYGRVRAGGGSEAQADARTSQGSRSDPGEAGDELHLNFNFHFLDQPWSAERFRDAVALVERHFRAHAWPCYTLSNHDRPRHAARFDDGGNGRVRARVAAVMLLTLRGTPFLYYGEEIGMRNVPIPERRWQDPVGRDGERTPMQWDASAGAGFSTGTPWLPPAKDFLRVNVARQREDPASLLDLYRRLIRLRKASAALRVGSYRAIPRTPPGVFAYLRELERERFLIALNFWSRRRTLHLGRLGSGRIEISTDPERDAREIGLETIELAPNEGVVLRLD